MKIVWSDVLSVGSDEMDQQHKKLIAIINALAACMDAEFDVKLIETIVAQMLSYAQEHFEAEEQLMREIGFPELESHIEMHQNFRYRVMEFSRPENINAKSCRLTLLTYLSDWLTSHILTEDDKYHEYLPPNGNVRS
jgi:hemerythrin